MLREVVQLHVSQRTDDDSWRHVLSTLRLPAKRFLNSCRRWSQNSGVASTGSPLSSASRSLRSMLFRCCRFCSSRSRCKTCCTYSAALAKPLRAACSSTHDSSDLEIVIALFVVPLPDLSLPRLFL